MSDELEVTPASEWGVQTVRVRLPSGRVADLRKKWPAYMLLRTGQIDGDLLAAFEDAMAGQLRDAEMALRLTDAVLTSMFVSPRIGEGGISPDVLDDDDIQFVMFRAFGGGPDGGFRGEPDGVAGGAGGGEVADAAVGVVGGGVGDGGGADAGSAVGGKARRARKPAAPKQQQ